MSFALDLLAKMPWERATDEVTLRAIVPQHVGQGEAAHDVTAADHQ